MSIVAVSWTWKMLMSAAALLLIVEDEPLILMDVEAALEDAGFEVVTATNAEAAMALYDERSAEIRAVLTDVRLGQGLSGWDVARHARLANPTMPIVYVSGDSAGEWAVQGVPNSVMIPKPYAFAQIVTALANLMNAPDQLLSQPPAAELP
jgi:DNA-binding response OmpR family regulator